MSNMLVKIYVNTEYDNVASVGQTMDDALSNFGNISWRVLFENVLGYDLSQDLTRHQIEEQFGVKAHEYADTISEAFVDRFYSQLSYYTDFHEGAAAQAYRLVRESGVVPVDSDGCGSCQGIELFVEAANGPSRQLIVSNEESARWLVDELKKAGRDTEIEFV